MAEVSFELPSKEEARSASDAKIKTGLSKLKEYFNSKVGTTNLESEAVTTAKLAASAKPVTWYEPKVIATEESRESTSFGTLTTKDEITGIVVPANGLLVITYVAQAKNSVAGAGKVAIFVGANQMAETSGLSETSFNRVATEAGAFQRTAATATVTTGRILQSLQIGELAAGTYSVSVQFKASSGTITAKERVLRVEVHGV